MKLVISIPIHENEDVVIDQVENISKFTPCATIVFHVSAQMALTENLRRSVVDRGHLINPQRFSTQWLHSFVPIHLSNFSYANSEMDFDYFSIEASNCLHIRTGLETYIAQSDFGCQTQQFWDHSKWSALPWMRHNFPDLPRIGSQIEGQFYRRGIFEQMSDIFNRGDRSHLSNCPAEEIFFSSVAHTMKENLVGGLPYILFNHDRDPTTQDVDALRDGSFELHNNISTCDTDHPYPRYDLANIYGVKRVERTMNSRLRTHIRSLDINQ